MHRRPRRYPSSKWRCHPFHRALQGVAPRLSRWLPDFGDTTLARRHPLAFGEEHRPRQAPSSQSSSAERLSWSRPMVASASVRPSST